MTTQYRTILLRRLYQESQPQYDTGQSSDQQFNSLEQLETSVAARCGPKKRSHKRAIS